MTGSNTKESAMEKNTTHGDDDAADAGSESPEEGAAAMADAEEAVVDSDTD